VSTSTGSSSRGRIARRRSRPSTPAAPVEDHQVVRIRAEPRDRRFAGLDRVDGKSRVAQPVDDGLAEGAVVFHHEDTHARGTLRSVAPPRKGHSFTFV
jgi:hypothetical protein